MRRPFDGFLARAREESAPRARDAERSMEDVLRALRRVEDLTREEGALETRLEEASSRVRALREEVRDLRRRVEEAERARAVARAARARALLSTWTELVSEGPGAFDSEGAQEALEKARAARRGLAARRDQLREALEARGVRAGVLDALVQMVRERPTTAERYLREFLAPRRDDARRERSWRLPADVFREVRGAPRSDR